MYILEVYHNSEHKAKGEEPAIVTKGYKKAVIDYVQAETRKNPEFVLDFLARYRERKVIPCKIALIGGAHMTVVEEFEESFSGTL